MVRDVAHRDRSVRSGVRPGTSEGESIVYYDILKDAERQTDAELGSLQIIISTPGQPSRTVPLKETAPAHYEARVSGEQYGLYRIVSDSPSLILPEAGFYRQSEEMKPQEINFPLLSEISRVTGGHLNPTTAQLLDGQGSYVRESRALWPYSSRFLLYCSILWRWRSARAITTSWLPGFAGLKSSSVHFKAK